MIKRARSQKAVQQRYQEILSRTGQLFLEQEYEDITLTSIAEDLQLSRPSLYNYFNSKEALFLALLEKEYLTCQKDLEQYFTCQLPVKNFFSQLVSDIYTRPLFVKLLSLHASVFETKLGYEVMLRFKKKIQPFFKTLTSILERQFPNSSEAQLSLFMAQFCFLLTIFHQYHNIPDDQAAVIDELQLFGSTALPAAQDFFVETLCTLAKELT